MHLSIYFGIELIIFFLVFRPCYFVVPYEIFILTPKDKSSPNTGGLNANFCTRLHGIIFTLLFQMSLTHMNAILMIRLFG